MRNSLIRFFTNDQPVAVVILLNAVLLFILSFEEAAPYVFELELIDTFFLLYFLVEAILKIRIQGWQEYIGQAWNRFDFVIVLFSIPSIFLLFYSDVPDDRLAFVFVFRVIRVARFVKFFRFIPNLDELVAGIRRAFKASIFVIVAFMVFGFIVSLISCRLFKDIAPDLFGNPIASFYSIFKVFTIEGWYEVPERIIRFARLDTFESFLIKLYFILIVGTGGLFGLSIVNAIFVEEMVRDNNDQLESDVRSLHAKVDELLSQIHNIQASHPEETKPPEDQL
ncbi:MAG: ion transporter [Bacteroidota bacterium]